MATAYSYVRFSSPEQAAGDSLRRQTEAAASYCSQHGLVLDTELTLQDLGKSAYNGQHAAVGNLGKFLEAVRSGRVAPGSYLLIENLDRLSRQMVWDAVSLLREIISAGVAVVTLDSGKVLTRENVDRDIGTILEIVLKFVLAHEESGKKSRRLSAAWQNKRERAGNGEQHRMTAMCPAWLSCRLVEQQGQRTVRVYDVIPERAELIKRMFAEHLQGHGYVGIARRLNAEHVPAFAVENRPNRKPSQWHHSYIKRLLSDRRLLGEFQPRRNRQPDGPVIRDYFPAIIDEVTFARAQQTKAASGKSRAGEPRPLQNLLSGLCWCAECQSRVQMVNKGKRRATSKTASTYLHCGKARSKAGCTAPSWRYDDVRSAALEAIVYLTDTLNELFPGSAQADELRGKLTANRVEQDRLTAEIERLTAAIATGTAPASLVNAIAEREAQREGLGQEELEMEAQLQAHRPAKAQAEEVRAAMSAAFNDPELSQVDRAALMHSIFARPIERIELGQREVWLQWRSGERLQLLELAP